jgi:LPS sulfotransferase NodH
VAVPMLFVIGSPRSGTTMMERMLSSHSMILGGPEPHLLTPLAHLGVWAKVDKAPYDHVLAAEAQKLYVSQLPNKEQDYWDACRAYCDVIYGRLLSTSDRKICLDKTPANALILPFMTKVFPDAKYVVLTRHPLAAFSSFANSFFDGDYAAAQSYNPLLNRYVPAMAAFLRQTDVSLIHVRYEDLVKAPEDWMAKVCEYIGVPFEPAMIEYGKGGEDESRAKGLGDPIGVKQHERPTTASLTKWAEELAVDNAKLEMMRGVIAQLDPDDLNTIGYPLDTLWRPMESVAGHGAQPKPQKLSRYRLQRKLIVRLRAAAKKPGALRSVLRKLQLACDVLLRE